MGCGDKLEGARNRWHLTETPQFPWQQRGGCRNWVDACLGRREIPIIGVIANPVQAQQ
jgi:hypothetical protein